VSGGRGTLRPRISDRCRSAREVREFARLHGSESFNATEEAEAGMAEMSKVYDDTGRELYMGAGDREHD
jgi:phosphomethylpyrimidine synthase